MKVVQPHAALLLPSTLSHQPAPGMLLPGWMVPEQGAGTGPSLAAGGQQPRTLRAGWMQANHRRGCTELEESDGVAVGREALLPQHFWEEKRGFQPRCCLCRGAAEPRVQVLLALVMACLPGSTKTK